MELIRVGGEGGSARQATADSGGHFLFDGVPPGDYVLWAESERGTTLLPDVDGTRANWRDVRSLEKITVGSPAANKIVRVQLVGSAEIEGRVIDEKDRPLPGVIVYIRTELDRRLQVKNTGPSGEFRSRIAPDTEYHLGIAASGSSSGSYSPTQFPPLKSGERKDDHLLRYHAPAEVRILVTDEEGKPIEGALVLPSTPSSWSSNARGPVFGAFENNRTGPDGYLIDRGWGHIWYYMEVCAAGFEPTYLDLHVRDREKVEERVTLQRISNCISLAGVVVSSLDQKPIHGAVVMASYQATVVSADSFRIDDLPGGIIVESPSSPVHRCREATTDISGRFTLRGVRGSSCHVAARADGYLPMESFMAEDGQTGLRIVLTPGREVEGQVVFAKGDPVEGALVCVSGHCTTTDASGRFRLRGIKPDEDSLAVRGEDVYFEAFPLPQEPAGPIRLEVSARDVFEGTVLDPDGNLVTNAILESSLTLQGEDKSVSNQITTNGEGHFRFRWRDQLLRPAAGTLRVLVPAFLEFECLPIEVPGFSFSPAGNVIRFERGLRAGVIVLDEDGRPVSGAGVRCNAVGDGYFITDAEGRTSIGPLKPGKVTLEVGGGIMDPFEQKFMEVEPGLEETTIQVRRNGK